MYGGDAPAPVTNNYEETMREALEAQVDMAPELYSAEANETYGRPAYARLNQRLIETGLLGEEFTVDNEGYTTRFKEGATPEGGVVVENKWEDYIERNNLHQLASGYDNDGTRAMWTKDLSREEIAERHYGLHGKEEGRTVREAGIYDAEGNKVEGASYKEYVGGPAGTRTEGGAVELLAGNQETKFADGSIRKAGFDGSGNFMGTSQLEQDRLERAKRQQTQTELSLVSDFGNQLTDLYRGQGGIKDALDSYNQLGRETSDHGGLRSGLVGMAAEELALGGQLSDRERRRVEQTSREAMSARGRGRDFMAVADEVAANETLSRQRESERRLFASQVLGLADSGLGQDRAFAAQRVGLEQATSADPFMAITGKTSGAAVGSGQNLYGNAAAGVNAGPALFNPAQGAEFMANQSAMINDYNSNVYAADQAMTGAIMGGVFGAAGNLGAAKIRAGCWVAREVYGTHSPKWLLFRYWMFNLSPFWFRAAYLSFGERFAKFIKKKPRLKARIRGWMDKKIKEVI